MRTDVELPQRVEISVARPNNVLFIENNAEGVTIYALRDNFSARERSCFIHYLAAEGFIPEVYQRIAEPAIEGSGGMVWIVDDGRVPAGDRGKKPYAEVLRVISWASLLWFLLMLGAVLHKLP